MIPDGLHDARKSRRRPKEVGNLVEDDDKGFVPCQRGEIAQCSFPGAEATAGEIERVLSETPADGLGEPCELDRLRLLGRAEEDRA